MHNILYKIKEVGSEARARFEQNSHIREILLRRPELTQLVSEQARAQTQLRPLYEEYVTSVSTADMAVSLPIASLCLALCRIEHPKRILDLGSGFSSFIFRMHATELGGCEVYSADDSAEWLHKTRDYLITKQMPATNLYEWPLPKDTDKFDFIFHDLGSRHVRADTLKEVYGLANPGAFIVLDDSHKIGYAARAQAFLSSINNRYYSLRRYTFDPKARFDPKLYAVLVVKK